MCVCVCARARACVRVRACVRACVCVCVCLPLSLLFFPNIVHFCYVYELFLLMTLVYSKHYHNIAVSCTKTGIKHDRKKGENERQSWTEEEG